ncbi:hypothetical protein HOH45_08800 [bacterium]|nr:hypothetical protein [bacterium]
MDSIRTLPGPIPTVEQKKTAKPTGSSTQEQYNPALPPTLPIEDPSLRSLGVTPFNPVLDQETNKGAAAEVDDEDERARPNLLSATQGDEGLSTSRATCTDIEYTTGLRTTLKEIDGVITQIMGANRLGVTFNNLIERRFQKNIPVESRSPENEKLLRDLKSLPKPPEITFEFLKVHTDIVSLSQMCDPKEKQTMINLFEQLKRPLSKKVILQSRLDLVSTISKKRQSIVGRLSSSSPKDTTLQLQQLDDKATLEKLKENIAEEITSKKVAIIDLFQTFETDGVLQAGFSDTAHEHILTLETEAKPEEDVFKYLGPLLEEEHKLNVMSYLEAERKVQDLEGIDVACDAEEFTRREVEMKLQKDNVKKLVFQARKSGILMDVNKKSLKEVQALRTKQNELTEAIHSLPKARPSFTAGIVTPPDSSRGGSLSRAAELGRSLGGRVSESVGRSLSRLPFFTKKEPTKTKEGLEAAINGCVKTLNDNKLKTLKRSIPSNPTAVLLKNIVTDLRQSAKTSKSIESQAADLIEKKLLPLVKEYEKICRREDPKKALQRTASPVEEGASGGGGGGGGGGEYHNGLTDL